MPLTCHTHQQQTLIENFLIKKSERYHYSDRFTDRTANSGVRSSI